MRWKTDVKKQAALRPVQTGGRLPVDIDAVFRCISRWRSFLPNPSISDDTRWFVMRAPCPRSAIVDGFLSKQAGNRASFTITKLAHTGADKYSQVYFGQLDGVNQEVVLKLLDDRCIPPGSEDAFEFLKYSGSLLTGLIVAEDMLRREEAVYEDRLKYLQGTMIPHCYGFHYVCQSLPLLQLEVIIADETYKVTLPDGWRAPGILLERITGPAFHEIDLQPDLGAPRPMHLDLVNSYSTFSVITQRASSSSLEEGILRELFDTPGSSTMIGMEASFFARQLVATIPTTSSTNSSALTSDLQSSTPGPLIIGLKARSHDLHPCPDFLEHKVSKYGNL